MKIIISALVGIVVLGGGYWYIGRSSSALGVNETTKTETATSFEDAVKQEVLLSVQLELLLERGEQREQCIFQEKKCVVIFKV